jgi:hypothetical protein
MTHGLMYQGAFERNYPLLAPGRSTFVATDGAEQPLPPWPDDVDGVRVGYMERRGKRFLAVRLQFAEFDLVLRNPVPLDKLRHLGGQRFAARPTRVSDDAASALLDDVLEQNPDQTRELALLINRVNQVRRGDSEEF